MNDQHDETGIRRVRRNASLSQELGEFIDRPERESIDRLGMLLGDRPTPPAGFRAELNAHLRGLIGTRTGWRPARPGILAAAYLCSGLILLVIAALGATGASPAG